MHVEDPYHELGLPPDSSDAEVKAAWRRLSARWHPDRNDSPHALRKIQRINRALEEIRKARAQSGTSADDTTGDDDDEEAAPAAQPARPVPEHTVDLTLEEVARGCVKDLRGEVIEVCAECDGTGQERDETECPDCHGTGSIKQAMWFGWVSSTATCGACNGHGSIRYECEACEASGKVARDYRCRVRIAPGAREGDLLHASARVQGSKEGVALQLRVALQPHELFTAEADGTVCCEVPVDGFAWTANRWTEVPTPRGLQQMKLRRGFMSYRIKDAGLPWGPGGAAADCIVTVVPLFPDELDAQQEAVIDELVQGNTGAADTEAGERMARWKDRVDHWHAQFE